jgi:hypothetical protein
MTRDDIIRIAREAGFVTDEADFIYPPKTPRRGIGLEIERVIVLAAAAEREACAEVCDSFKFSPAADAIRARGKA